jgi:acetyltransferase
VTLQPYFANPDYEILLGAKRDPNFGPVILFGMGGIYTEVLKDRSLGLPPMNRLLARRLMQETKAYSLLQGYRNRPAADMERLEEMIIRLSQLLIDFPEIAELDMNPVLIKDGNPVAVDARILLSPLAVPSSLHLVISPYPQEDESHMVSADGRRNFYPARQARRRPAFHGFVQDTFTHDDLLSFLRRLKRTQSGDAGPIHPDRLRPGDCAGGYR